MTTMLPTEGSRARSLAVLGDEFLAVMAGRHGALGLTPVRSVIVVVVDGLGTANLAERTGHARFLSAHRGRSLRAPIPSTTAAALPTILTGTLPGRHGMLGYRVRDPQTGSIVNQLTGWDELASAHDWQRAQTVFEKVTQTDAGAAALGPRRFVGSGFTREVLRGSRYVPAETIADRVDAAVSLIEDRHPHFIYLYIPELDKIAHRSGWTSDRWLAGLEIVDAEIARLHRQLAATNTGILVTADHGIVDVPASSHVLYDAPAGLLDGVDDVGGEPRFLQLYSSRSDEAPAIAERWRAEYGDVAHVATRAEAVENGWYGDVDPVVTPRIGDVLIAARTRVAFYDSSPAHAASRRMVGQHGSLSDEERTVPFIRLGAWE